MFPFSAIQKLGNFHDEDILIYYSPAFIVVLNK